MELYDFSISLKNVNDLKIHLWRLYYLVGASHRHKNINLNRQQLSDFENIKLNYDLDLIICIRDDLVKI